jgi:hypothetical protein
LIGQEGPNGIGTHAAAVLVGACIGSGEIEVASDVATSRATPQDARQF